MTSFETGVIVGAVIGVCVAYLGIVVVHWWLDHRVERVELDDAWIRFTDSDTYTTNGTQRIP